MSTQYHIIYNRTESNLVKLLGQLTKLTIKRNNDLLILKKVAKYFITADYNSGLTKVKSDFEALTYDDVKNLSPIIERGYSDEDPLFDDNYENVLDNTYKDKVASKILEIKLSDKNKEKNIEVIQENFTNLVEKIDSHIINTYFSQQYDADKIESIETKINRILEEPDDFNGRKQKYIDKYNSIKENKYNKDNSLQSLVEINIINTLVSTKYIDVDYIPEVYYITFGKEKITNKIIAKVKEINNLLALSFNTDLQDNLNRYLEYLILVNKFINEYDYSGNNKSEIFNELISDEYSDLKPYKTFDDKYHYTDEDELIINNYINTLNTIKSNNINNINKISKKQGELSILQEKYKETHDGKEFPVIIDDYGITELPQLEEYKDNANVIITQELPHDENIDTLVEEINNLYNSDNYYDLHDINIAEEYISLSNEFANEFESGNKKDLMLAKTDNQEVKDIINNLTLDDTYLYSSDDKTSLNEQYTGVTNLYNEYNNIYHEISTKREELRLALSAYQSEYKEEYPYPHDIIEQEPKELPQETKTQIENYITTVNTIMETQSPVEDKYLLKLFPKASKDSELNNISEDDSKSLNNWLGIYPLKDEYKDMYTEWYTLIDERLINQVDVLFVGVFTTELIENSVEETGQNIPEGSKLYITGAELEPNYDGSANQTYFEIKIKSTTTTTEPEITTTTTSSTTTTTEPETIDNTTE